MSNDFMSQIMSRMNERFDKQKSEGMCIMGSVEEFYFDALKKVFAGAQLRNVCCVDVTSFCFIRSCIADGCRSRFEKRGPFIVSSNDRNKIFMTDSIFKNYCATYGHDIPMDLEVHNLLGDFDGDEEDEDE